MITLNLLFVIQNYDTTLEILKTWGSVLNTKLVLAQFHQLFIENKSKMKQAGIELGLNQAETVSLELITN